MTVESKGKKDCGGRRGLVQDHEGGEECQFNPIDTSDDCSTDAEQNTQDTMCTINITINIAFTC